MYFLCDLRSSTSTVRNLIEKSPTVLRADCFVITFICNRCIRNFGCRLVAICVLIVTNWLQSVTISYNVTVLVTLQPLQLHGNCIGYAKGTNWRNQYTYL